MTEMSVRQEDSTMVNQHAMCKKSLHPFEAWLQFFLFPGHPGENQHQNEIQLLIMIFEEEKNCLPYFSCELYLDQVHSKRVVGNKRISYHSRIEINRE